MEKVFIIADRYDGEKRRLLAKFLGEHEILATVDESKAKIAILINPSFDKIRNAKAAYSTVIVVADDSDSPEFRRRCMESGATAVITSDMGVVGWANEIARILGK